MPKLPVEVVVRLVLIMYLLEKLNVEILLSGEHNDKQYNINIAKLKVCRYIKDPCVWSRLGWYMSILFMITCL